MTDRKGALAVLLALLATVPAIALAALTVYEATLVKEAPLPGYCVVSTLDVFPQSVRVGDKATVVVLVSNPGETSVECPIEVRANGRVVVSRLIPVQGLSSATVSLEVSLEEPGDYLLTVGKLYVPLKVRPR